jgi:hypothetical protein
MNGLKTELHERFAGSIRQSESTGYARSAGQPNSDQQCFRIFIMVSIGLVAGLFSSTVALSQTAGSPFGFPQFREAGIAESQIITTQHTRGRVESVRIQPEDEVWVVSARDSHIAPSDLSLLKCWRLETGNWEPTELDQLVQTHAEDKSRVTVVYVHGDRTNLNWAKSRGLQFYACAFGAENRPPVRFVIFAWRAEKEKTRPIPDHEIKSRRSMEVGETLGTLLSRFEDRRMILGGFSLGAQVVLTALSKPELQDRDQRMGKFRVAFFGHVLNPDFIRTELEMYPDNPRVEHTDVFLNQEDRVVRLSHLIKRKTIRSNSTLEQLANSGQTNGNSIMVRDITRETSKKHSISEYGRSPQLNQRLAIVLDNLLESNVVQNLTNRTP